MVSAICDKMARSPSQSVLRVDDHKTNHKHAYLIIGQVPYLSLQVVPFGVCCLHNQEEAPRHQKVEISFF